MERQTLIDLIDHETWIPAHVTLSAAFERFREHSMEYMAVLKAGEFIGLCSRQDLGMLLGSQYGFSLNASRLITECLRPNPAQLIMDSDVHEAFERVFARSIEAFYDDVVVLDRQGQFCGLIFTHTLVRLQSHYHKESISLLQHQTRAIESQNLRMEADLRLCWELQRALLPESYPSIPMPICPERSAFSFRHLYQSHHIVGGDFIHVQRISEHRVGILIADVMGHNVRCALVTTMIRTLLEELAPRFSDPGELLTCLNHRLAGILARGNHEVVYATALYLMLDATDLSGQFATAAHPAPILLSNSDAKVHLIEHENGGTLLGVFDDAVYESSPISVTAGDSLLLYTDGVFEVQNPGGDLWGQSGLLQILEKAVGSHESDQLLVRIVNEAQSFSGQKEFQDDVCLLVVQIEPQS
jgi:serine phosphatase RsbU (regulator of sigma subunit)